MSDGQRLEFEDDSNNNPNWIDYFVETVSQFTNVPISIIKLSAYFAVSSALGKRVYYRQGPPREHPNLYMMVVGAPAKFHKSTATGCAMYVAKLATRNRVQLLPSGGSDVGFLESLIENGGWGVLYYDEMQRFIDECGKDYGVEKISWMTELYHPQPLEMVRRNKSGNGERLIIPPGSTMNFLANCTEEQLATFLSGGKITGGLASRMFIFVARPEHLREDLNPGGFNPPDWMYSALSLRMTAIIPRSNRFVSFREDANAECREWVKVYEEWIIAEGDTILETMTARFEHMIRKLAVLYAVADGRFEVHAGDFDGDLINDWLFSMRCVANVAETGTMDRGRLVRSEVMSNLMKNDFGTVDLIAASTRRDPREIRDAIGILHQHGRIYGQLYENSMWWAPSNGIFDSKKENLMAQKATLRRMVQQKLTEASNE